MPSAGRVPNGATVEREVPNGFTAEPFVILNLHVPDFTTSARLTEGINKLLGEGTAQSVDSVSVKVAAPADSNQRTAYLATLEADRNRAGRRARARHRQFAHRHGGHRLARARDAGGRGTRFVVGHHHRARRGQPAERIRRRDRPWWCRRARISVSQPEARMFVFDAGVDLNDIVRAVNQVGAAPGDLVAILEALKESGALRAELIVI